VFQLHLTSVDRTEYDRLYYQRNKQKRQAQAKAHRQALRDSIRQYKATHPCTDCGGFFHPAAMQFDHLGDKCENIADMVRLGKARKVWAEIEKCELVCANCHAVRTEDRQGEGVSGSPLGLEPRNLVGSNPTVLI
jgi:5-methylcytosine-specific restriction endonuclease McrA